MVVWTARLLLINYKKMFHNCNGKGNHHGMCDFAMIGKVLLIIGGINWGLIGYGIFTDSNINMNAIHWLLGAVPSVEAVLYILIGVAAIMKICGCGCNRCKEGCKACGVDGKER